MQFTFDRGKRPDEQFDIEVDFTDDVESGDTIVTASVEAFDQDAPATDLTATLTENLVDVGLVVGCRIKAGTAGKTYVFRFQITTAAGDIFQHDVLVSVSETA